MSMTTTVTTIDPDRLAAFERLHLHRGKHAAPPPDCEKPEMCAMEARAWLRAERHTDQYPSATLGAFMRGWNDGLPDSQRDLLKPLVLEIAQAEIVVTPEAEQVRGLLLADWHCREWTPTWLELAKLAEAAALRAFRPLLTWDDVAAIKPLLRSARDAAGDAAWAAGDATWAAGDAAWDAARAAAGAAAGDAAGDAARDAAWVAGDAALAAAWAARVAGAALAPTVVQLQQSAMTLVRRMIAVEG